MRNAYTQYDLAEGVCYFEASYYFVFPNNYLFSMSLRFLCIG